MRKVLGYFVGTWAHRGVIRDTVFGAGGAFAYTEKCEWFTGGLALVCRSSGRVPEGTMKGLSIIAWDAAEKAFAYFEINSGGEVIYSRGTVRRGTWLWKNASKRLLNGKAARTRMTVRQVSHELARYKLEIGAPRQPLKLVMEGTQTRIG